ncbi:hypothetical protein [Streptomyces sp. NBC_00557]|uniref:hypothetical protein n=1 Tax=Streptomyces sp. NBC_00557 TaxID=2975776 RepID=UPI002E81A2A8|nr:hypothetical protein [Streptomyces sp. NBC_00557]WUC39515.1 hypothetical protein OG956_37605 [Streptomyces sp. NBC_00557]
MAKTDAKTRTQDSPAKRQAAAQGWGAEGAGRVQGRSVGGTGRPCPFPFLVQEKVLIPVLLCTTRKQSAILLWMTALSPQVLRQALRAAAASYSAGELAYLVLQR